MFSPFDPNTVAYPRERGKGPVINYGEGCYKMGKSIFIDKVLNDLQDLFITKHKAQNRA